MKFDWYAATLPEAPEAVIGAALHAFDLASVRPGKPLHGYTDAAEVHRGDTVLLRCLWGGHNGPDTHAWASGTHAPEWAELAREEWQGHRVTRVDVAADFCAPEVWPILYRAATQLADKYGLKTQLVGDYLGEKDGRTMYLGAPSSPVRVRLYEKGKQVRGDPNWVRAEVVVKPKNKEARVQASRMAPNAVWGAAAWTAEYAEQLGGPVARWKAGTVWQPEDDDRAYKALLRQYGPLLTRLAGSDWEGLGKRLREDITGCSNG